MRNPFTRRHPVAAPVDTLDLHRERQRAEERVEADRVAGVLTRSRVLAEQAAERDRCPLTAEQIQPLCELTVAVRDLAAANGHALTRPDPQEIAAIAEDLATRRFRRGYDIHSPAIVLAGALYPAVNMYGEQIGFSSVNEYGSAIARTLPAGHNERMNALQHINDRSLYDALCTAGVQHSS